MTERSYFWFETAVGDASLADYDLNEVADIMMLLFSFDNTLVKVSPGNGLQLAVTNPSGVTIRVASGMALVDGTAYESTANIDLTVAIPGSGTNYYRVVLRKSWAAQTIRVVLLGPDVGAYPTITQSDGVTWEVSLARVSVTAAGAVTITDDRKIYRGSGYGLVELANVDEFLSERNDLQHMQCGTWSFTGTGSLSGSFTITFPVAYKSIPWMIAQGWCDQITGNQSPTIAVDPTTSGATIYWTIGSGSPTYTYYFSWMAIGEIDSR